MRRLIAVILFCAGIFCVAQSSAQFNGCPAGFCTTAQLSMTGAGFSGGGGGGGSYTAQGVHFNGSTELWAPSGLSGGMTGAADSTKGTFSGWFKEGQDGTTDGLQASFSTSGGSACQIVRISSGNYWRLICQTSAAANVMVCGTTAALNVAAGWTHIVASWDTTIPVLQVYVNGVSDACGNAGPTATAGTIDYGPANTGGQAVGSLVSANYYTGDMADVYFDQAHRIDLSVSANLQKFISGGNAVDLGTNCATPTGSQPIICLRGPVGTWNNNVGSGGAFTIHAGSLSAASSNPP